MKLCFFSNTQRQEYFITPSRYRVASGKFIQSLRMDVVVVRIGTPKTPFFYLFPCSNIQVIPSQDY